MIISKKTKGICSVIGGALFHIGIGIINPLGNYNVYLISYINHFSKTHPYQLYYGYLIKTFISFFLLCFSPLGGMIDRKIGCHLTMIVSAVAQLASIGILFKVTSIRGLYFGIILLSIGMGIGIRAPVKNACYFMPEHKGFISAIIFSIGGLSSPLFNLVGEAIINPNNKRLSPNETYYDYSLMKNIFRYYHIGVIGIIASTVFSLCFIFQYKQEDYRTIPPPHNKNIEEIKEADADEETEAERNETQEQSKEDYYYSDLKQIICSYRVWNIFLISFFGNFLPFIISISFKAIGTYLRFSVEMLKVSTSLMGIVKNGISLLWGYLFDRIGYGPLIKITNIFAIGMGVLMCFSLQNEIFFGVLGVLNTVFIAGFRSVLDPLVMKIYTIDYIMELGGIISLSLGSTSMVGTVIALTTSNDFIDKNNAYYFMFILGAGLSFVSLLLCFLETEKRFVFKRQKKKNFENVDEDQIRLLK